MTATLNRLDQVIRERRITDPALSYVAKLTSKGRGKIAQKVGEEAVETVIAAMADDRDECIKEAADLVFHLGILLADMGLSFDNVMAELDRRDGLSGLTEKAARPKD
jgi:phosphoribosyl-ATP pyrophosphohydrolase